MSDETAVKAKTLVQKLAEIVAEIDNVDKRGRNEFQKYAYVKATDVAWLVRKALSTRNIYLVSDVVEVRNYEIPAREGTMQAVDVKMELTFIDGDVHSSGSWDPMTGNQLGSIKSHAWGTGTDKGDKAIYKAMTGALKYGLRHAFLIPDESDPEADVETDKATANAKAVGEAKVAKLKEKSAANGSEATAKAIPTLFFTYPESHNGHKAEWVNIANFLSTRPDIELQVRTLFTSHKATKSKDDTALVPREHMQALCEQLVGEMGLTIKELHA